MVLKGFLPGKLTAPNWDLVPMRAPFRLVGTGRSRSGLATRGALANTGLGPPPSKLVKLLGVSTPPWTMTWLARTDGMVVVVAACGGQSLMMLLLYWSTPPPCELTMMAPLTCRTAFLLMARPGIAIGFRAITPSVKLASTPATARAMTV